MSQHIDTMPTITVPNFGNTAACIDADPDLFFPDKGENKKARQARAYCNACPMREVCLTWAVKENIRYGLWGGLTTEQRDEIRVKRDRRPAGNGGAQVNKDQAAERRQQVIELTQLGMSVPAISEQLGLSRRTILSHRSIARTEGLL